jgi:hypothetical protein
MSYCCRNICNGLPGDLSVGRLDLAAQGEVAA